MLAVSGASGINPAQMGVILAYTSTLHCCLACIVYLLMGLPAQLSQILGVVTRQSAEVENYMNSVERVVHYSRGDLIEQEAPHEKPDTKPPSTWPSTGAIKMEGVTMAYRKDLPDVLKGQLVKPIYNMLDANVWIRHHCRHQGRGEDRRRGANRCREIKSNACTVPHH